MQASKTKPKYPASDPRVEALVTEVIGRVADKWTMLILETLEEHGCLRFSRVAGYIPGISQKMLTQTLRQMERDGLVKRTVHPVIPPHVDYQLTGLGESLGEAFCGVWQWAEANLALIERSRSNFDRRTSRTAPKVPSSKALHLADRRTATRR
jgi:DNA-binding HxlR family transcriptional regulator